MEDIYSLQEYILKDGTKCQLTTENLDPIVESMLTCQLSELVRNWRFPRLETSQPSASTLNNSNGLISRAFFLENKAQFVLVGAGYVQIWSLPEDINGDC
ncbi:hypothetical protein BGX27_005932, partial [Mortierella sp. AM989]